MVRAALARVAFTLTGTATLEKSAAILAALKLDSQHATGTH